MSSVVILGAGISGHTAAAYARKWLGRDDTATVVSPNGSYNWIPSNIWVGVGLMGPYDFLINATGPRLRFDKTPGLGPDGHSLSVCTVEHALQA